MTVGSSFGVKPPLAYPCEGSKQRWGVQDAGKAHGQESIDRGYHFAKPLFAVFLHGAYNLLWFSRNKYKPLYSSPNYLHHPP